jgi:maltooligosyltrehalose trehalohydrolase
MEIGAQYNGNGRADFTVWAPFSGDIKLRLLTSEERLVDMEKDALGYWRCSIEDIVPGTRYLFRIDNDRDRPDPASCSQPDGVHEASEVIDHSSFTWNDDGWKPIPLREMIIYELHIGTFTEEGTFDSAIGKLGHIRDTGINTIEIMPVAQFPGGRNWGYDGVYPFAVQNTYGGAEGMKRFVDACHQQGLAVLLDVVYNHLGPEGNYLWDFGPYFTDRYRSPWGDAVNFDGPYSNEVRNYFIQNAIYWFRNFHIDGLRLDAVHGIYDFSARPFLQQLSDEVKEFSRRHGRKFLLIAESDLNDARLAEPPERGGYGLDGLWCDDFHHAVHTLATGERCGYYVDFGRMDQLSKALTHGFVYTGQYSEFRKRNHGNSSDALPADRFVVCIQNHDQVGNRMAGERLSTLVSFEARKLCAGILFLSPYVPLIFMGEEYGETAPFLYFVSHADEDLIRNVREGRKREFDSFEWNRAPDDPQSEETFKKSKLNWDLLNEDSHRILWKFYSELIRLRREIPALSCNQQRCIYVTFDEQARTLIFRRNHDDSGVLVVCNFGKSDAEVNAECEGSYDKVMESSDVKWKGPGAVLPDRIVGSSAITIRGESFGLFVARACGGAG